MKFHLIPCMLAAILLLGCSPPEEKIKGRTWEGEVYRNEDDKELSKVKLKMSHDTLFIFANAIFGASNDPLADKSLLT